MKQDKLLTSIPRSGTDDELQRRGFDLYREYLEIVTRAGFDPAAPVLELAGGPGRASAVLSRLGFTVLAGDLSLEKYPELMRRVTPAFASQVTTVQLDMERLPLRDHSCPSVLSLNTIHELRDPFACVFELVRVHQSDGPLVLSDFSKHGFEVMEEVHRAVHGKGHFQGTVGLPSLVPILRQRYREVDRFETPLNTAYIFRGKRPRL